MGNYQRPTIVAGLATRIIEVAARLGVEREFMLAEGHLDASALEERDNRVPVETFARLWHVLAARCPDRVLALDWVATWRITDAGVMGYVLQQLATLGDAMEAVGRYHTLVNQAATPRLVRGGTTSRLGFVLDPVLLATQQQPEAHLVSMVGFLRSVVSPEWTPLAVFLPHRPSWRTPALEKFVGAPVHHGQGEIAVEFPTSLFHHPLPNADPILGTYLRRQAEGLLQTIDKSHEISQQCARHIAERLGRGEPSQTEIAKLMGLSERTLQRRLSAEGTTFNGVLEDARRSIAVGFLADRKLAAYEVSFLLGYSEPATFFRAFKRWTGKTPQQYRATAIHA